MAAAAAALVLMLLLASSHPPTVTAAGMNARMKRNALIRQDLLRTEISDTDVDGAWPRRYEYWRGDLLRTDIPNAMALTFDDGPDDRWTPQILDVLKKHDVKATFFVVGELCELYPQLVRRYVQEGHALGVHTWNHPNQAKLKKRVEINRQIEKTLSVLESIVPGTEINLFRPPQGLFDDNMVKAVHAFGLSMVLWSLDTEDWKIVTSDIDIDKAIQMGRNRSIVLMHDGPDAADNLHRLGKKKKTSGYEGITRTDKENVWKYLDIKLGELKKQYQLIPIPP
jgi:peptidoglycan/xylan/chitin deacetylase (PgdA/CDA1 family)